MVEPLAVVIRNSLFPLHSVFRGTSSSKLSGGAMFCLKQPQFFSSNLFAPLPTQGKGKGKEVEGPRTRRVFQCREWSCCAARSFFYCRAHGIPYMLQELPSRRERPVRRFQNPKAHLSNRFNKSAIPRARSLPGVQRRHASHTTRTQLQSQIQPEASSSSSSMSSERAFSCIVELSTFAGTRSIPLKDFNLDHAWEAFNAVSLDSRCLKSVKDERVMLRFAERFCDKVELLYEADDSYDQLKCRRAQFRIMIEWVQERLQLPISSDFMAIQHLISRCRAMFGQFDASIEILEKVRAVERENFICPSIIKTYTSIYSSIFYFHDAIHVVNFLDQHFFYEYFRPPYCFFYRDKDPAALVNRHPRLLYILSTINHPLSLFNPSLTIARTSDWHHIGTLLILAYCHHKLPQAALRVHDAVERRDSNLDNLLTLRVVRALARGGYFDDAYRLYSMVPECTPEYNNTGMHLFALQGDQEVVQRYFVKKRGYKHEKAMLLFVFAFQGMTIKVRQLFDELYPQLGPGEYVGAKPGIMDYAIAIFSHARRSDPEGIGYWMERMINEGLKPNLHIYSSIIQSYLQTGDLNAVADVLDQMREAGLRPNAVIYTDVITALGRHHKPSTAEGIFRRALQEDVSPDQAMVGALMNCYVEAGQWDEAVTLFKSLENNERTPLQLTIGIYNIALKGYVMMGAPFRVVATLFERLDIDANVAPNDITFALLLQSACESGYMHAAMDIFKEMDKRAKQGATSLINPYVFTILMSGFLRKGDKDKAMAIYEEMLNRGIQPTSVTFNTVLSYYSNEKSADSLRVAYEFMTRVVNRREDYPIVAEGNVHQSPIQLVYEPLLQACATNGNTEGFEKLLDEMLEAGGQLTVSVLSHLMNLYRQKNRMESATKIWVHLLELGAEAMKAARLLTEEKEDVEPRTDMLCIPLTIYLDMLSQSGEHEEVLETWQDYRRQGFSFNFFNWNKLGVYLICAGNYERAFEVMDRIIMPYIRITRNQLRGSSTSTTPSSENKDPVNLDGVWRSPFEVLNKTDLSFIQATILPNRPLTSSTRSKVLQRRASFEQDEEALATMSLQPLDSNPVPSTVTPSFNTDTESPSSSDPPSPSSSSSSSPPSSTFSSASSAFLPPPSPSSSTPPPQLKTHPEPLTLTQIPEFVRPLYAFAHMPEGNAPKVHFTLLHHLLLGLQRLRAGQPPVPSSAPSQLSSEELNYSSEQQKLVKEQLERIIHQYPDAVEAVMDFQEQERTRLGENYEKLYIWG